MVIFEKKYVELVVSKEFVMDVYDKLMEVLSYFWKVVEVVGIDLK